MAGEDVGSLLPVNLFALYIFLVLSTFFVALIAPPLDLAALRIVRPRNCSSLARIMMIANKSINAGK